MEFPAQCAFIMDSSTKICLSWSCTVFFANSVRNYNYYVATQEMSSELLQFLLLKIFLTEKSELKRELFSLSQQLWSFLLKRGSFDT